MALEGGSISSVPTGPGLPPIPGTGPFGRFTSVPRVPPVFRAGTIQNQSGIGHSAARILTVPHGATEVDGYKESWSRNSQQSVRVFDVPWGIHKRFVDAMLGWSTNFVAPGTPPGSAGQLLRILPQQHPEYPWQYATEIELLQGLGAIANNPNVVLQDSSGEPITEPIPGSSPPEERTIPLQMIGYYDSATGRDGLARMAITYTALPFELRTDAEVAALTAGEMERYLEREVTYAMSNLPLPPRVSGLELKFAEGPERIRGEPIPENGAGLLVPVQEITMIWHDVPDVPDAIKRDRITGRVNNRDFDGARGCPTYPKGTLLCQPPRVIRHRTIQGRVAWTIAFKFLYRNAERTGDTTPRGWNYFPGPDGNFYLVTAGGAPTGDQVYKEADFADLFKMPYPVTYQ